jgi:pimeloyl-ACP methyl ester carboxylesterase
MGELDWMVKADRGGSLAVVQANKKKFGDQSNYYICPNAGHDLNIGNPEGLVNIIINDIFYFSDD